MQRLCRVVMTAAVFTVVSAPCGEVEGVQPKFADQLQQQKIPRPKPGGCQPVTCEEAGATCGSISNGCGEVLDCGIAKSVTVTVDPPTYSGICPKPFTFTGKITVKKAGTARYHWRNTPYVNVEEEIYFAAPGTKQVTYTWHVSPSVPASKQFLEFGACGADYARVGFSAHCTALKPEETNP